MRHHPCFECMCTPAVLVERLRPDFIFECGMFFIAVRHGYVCLGCAEASGSLDVDAKKLRVILSLLKFLLQVCGS